MTDDAKKPFLGMSGKDWITVPLSVAAFSISAWTTYVNVIQQSDDIRLVAPRQVSIVADAMMQRFTVDSKPGALAFINSGHRPAVIKGASVWFTDDPKGDCRKGGWVAAKFPLSFEPVVLKEKSAATIPMELRPPRDTLHTRVLRLNANVSKEGDELVVDASRRLPNERLVQDGDVMIRTCLNVSFATPSLADGWVGIEIDLRRLEIENVFRADYSFPKVEPREPIVLYKRTGSIFSR
jgi:hypothetical protein